MKRKDELEEYFSWKNRKRDNEQTFFLTGGLIFGLANIKYGNTLIGAALVALIVLYFLIPSKGDR